jgi:hypothetical protein
VRLFVWGWRKREEVNKGARRGGVWAAAKGSTLRVFFIPVVRRAGLGAA